jgi:hypothetical protein
MCGGDREAHLTHAAGAERALEAAHQGGVVEHRPDVAVAEHEVGVGLVCRMLMVSGELACDPVGHRHGPTRATRFGRAPVTANVRAADMELAGLPVHVAPLQAE